MYCWKSPSLQSSWKIWWYLGTTTSPKSMTTRGRFKYPTSISKITDFLVPFDFLDASIYVPPQSYEKYGDLWDELGLEESRIRNCFTSDLRRFFPIAIIFLGIFMRAIIPTIWKISSIHGCPRSSDVLLKKGNTIGFIQDQVQMPLGSHWSSPVGPWVPSFV